MSKQIRIEDHVYDKLEAFRDKRETFSAAVERLLAASAEFNRLADILEGAAKFHEFKHGPEEIRDIQVR